MVLLYLFTSVYLLCYAYQALFLKEQAKQQRLMMFKIESIQVNIDKYKKDDSFDKECKVALARIEEMQGLLDSNLIEIKKDLNGLRDINR